ncbi:imidazole glycerol phosphate synthase subunit HisH [Defluviitalea saccharophila]|uniref:Imidazole glycerol phosphate synthase subunit HisH n=1 Tax=Defluviitalea saccharophila TaxID=879970 RepID=A0ABZ2Y805_9FIRM|nr:imidazole glycerol phosphate synthase subunit HisH [Candidatus Epulonipiscium sp.]
MSIAIIDYGMGNLRSVQKAFEFLGYEAWVTDNKEEIRQAEKIVLPGVGAFRDAIKTLKEKKLDEEMYRAVEEDKPFLGICLGMQLVFEKSYEYGEYEGLGLLKGNIVRLPNTVKVPHMGWNSLKIEKRAPLFEGLPEEPYVYFVHSYYLETDAPIVSATTFYGKEIQVAAQSKNIYVTQFHPEKSGNIGLKILKNFGGLKNENLSGN